MQAVVSVNYSMPLLVLRFWMLCAVLEAVSVCSSIS